MVREINAVELKQHLDSGRPLVLLDSGGRFLFGVGGGWNGAFPRERRPVGGAGRPLVRSVWGNLAPSGKRGRFPRELSFSPLLKTL